MFSFNFQIMADFSDVFGLLNFIAKLKQRPLDLNCVKRILAAESTTPRVKSKSCFISTMVTFGSMMFYFLKERASWHL